MAVINLVPIDHPVPVLGLTEQDMKTLGLKPGRLATVKAGTTWAKARIVTASEDSYASHGLLRGLELPESTGLRLCSGVSGLKAGPLIGILVSRGRRQTLPPHTAQNRLLHDFLSYCRSINCPAFVFTPAGVSPETRTISGHYLAPSADGTLKWKRHTFPLPDVVYDRILFRTVERKKATRLVTSFLTTDNNIHYFNPKFLNKWETHLILSQNQVLRQHLPETIRFNSQTNLGEFLADHRTVFVKPINGSLGVGIIRISQVPQGYCCQHRGGKKIISRTWATSGEVLEYLNDIIDKSGKTYVLQQGLDLIKYQERVFDIRVLLQKNGSGRWNCTAMVARIASEGSIFPNVAAGGDPRSMEAVWAGLTGQSWAASEVRERVEKVCLLAADTLEQSLGTFAEIGLDIGIDSRGQVWIIEINSKPSYKVFPKDQLNLKKTAIRQPIDFAVFLTEFGPDQPKEEENEEENASEQELFWP